MQLVYATLSYTVLSWPGFFSKLLDFAGEFRVEQQSPNDVARRQVTISFYTDKVKIPEGQPRLVELVAQRKGMTIDEQGSVFDDWEFVRIDAAY